jgi:hypothetical protein
VSLAIAPAWVLGVAYQLARVEVALGAGFVEAAQRTLEVLRRARLRVFAWALATSVGVVACALSAAAALQLVWLGSWQAVLGAILVELAALGALGARAGFIAVALGLRPPAELGEEPGLDAADAAPERLDHPDVSTLLQEDTGLE